MVNGELMSAGEVREACSRAAGSDVGAGSPAEVLDALRLLCEASTALSVAQAKLLQRADREEVTIDDAGLGVPAWLSRHMKRRRSACAHELTVARTAVEHFADCLDAVTTLEPQSMGWDHIEVLVKESNPRNREMLASVQADLIAAARTLSFRDWAALVAQIAISADADGGHDPNSDIAANRLRINTLGDATLDLTGRLVGETGYIVESTLEAVADELFHRYNADHELDASIDIPDRRTLRALALAETCRRARSIKLGNTAPARPETIIVIATDTNNTPTAQDNRGNAIAASALEMILSDADFRALLTTATRAPLALGHKRRFVTRDQRIALQVRDDGCVFPGCDIPTPWCDTHHVTRWKDGGNTDLANMALLCRHHHSITHRHGWTMNPTPRCQQDHGSLFQWATPTGKTLHSEHTRNIPPHPPPKPH